MQQRGAEAPGLRGGDAQNLLRKPRAGGERCERGLPVRIETVTVINTHMHRALPCIPPQSGDDAAPLHPCRIKALSLSLSLSLTKTRGNPLTSLPSLKTFLAQKKNSVTKSQVERRAGMVGRSKVTANGGRGWAGGSDVVARSGPALPAGPAQRAARLCGRA